MTYEQIIMLHPTIMLMVKDISADKIYNCLIKSNDRTMSFSVNKQVFDKILSFDIEKFNTLDLYIDTINYYTLQKTNIETIKEHDFFWCPKNGSIYVTKIEDSEVKIINENFIYSTTSKETLISTINKKGYIQTKNVQSYKEIVKFLLKEVTPINYDNIVDISSGIIYSAKVNNDTVSLIDVDNKVYKEVKISQLEPYYRIIRCDVTEYICGRASKALMDNSAFDYESTDTEVDNLIKETEVKEEVKKEDIKEEPSVLEIIKDASLKIKNKIVRLLRK